MFHAFPLSKLLIVFSNLASCKNQFFCLFMYTKIFRYIHVQEGSMSTRHMHVYEFWTNFYFRNKVGVHNFSCSMCILVIHQLQVSAKFTFHVLFLSQVKVLKVLLLANFISLLTRGSDTSFKRCVTYRILTLWHL